MTQDNQLDAIFRRCPDDDIKRWWFGEPVTKQSKCYDCPENAESECDHCGKGFCREHGDPGGDRDTESGTRAYPATCEACRASYEREMGGGK